MKKTTAQLKKEKYILTCTATGKFPTLDRKLTMDLGSTVVFDGRDDPQHKVSYYNAFFKGIATFQVFNLY